MTLIIVALFLLTIIITIVTIWKLLVPSSIKKICISLSKLLYMKYLVTNHSVKKNNKNYSFADDFEAFVDRHPDFVQFVCVEDSRSVTLQNLDLVSNQIANWGLKLGLKSGDTIALMMLNRPELVAFWVGFAKIGVSTALINTNSTGLGLNHAVKIVTMNTENKVFVVDSELKQQISSDLDELSRHNVKVQMWDELAKLLSVTSSARPPKTMRSSVIEKDPMLFIFTSGTTGLPKASKISHSRFYGASLPLGIFCNLGPKSRVYNCLPLYHSAGGMLGVGACLRFNACMVLRKKFSASNFAADCVRFQCNTFQYIGELCRYLCSTPVSDIEKQLKLKYAMGNGLRPDIWKRFQTRFQIKHIIEFYASTEGNVALFNSCDKVGALGFIPRFADFVYPVKIIKASEDDSSVPYRNASGFCESCKPFEKGLVISAIDNKRFDKRFEGYSDESATKKKLLKDVFEEGDCYFNSGDLMYRDDIGFFFWSDRTGDTFRWKGENVSTAEVSEVVSICPGVTDAVVYGVEIPGSDGKAGMASITIAEEESSSKQVSEDEKFSLESMYRTLSANLPPYSRPIFIRIRQELQKTSTFKHVKNDLVRESFNLSMIQDEPVYVLMSKQARYVPLTSELYEEIMNQKFTL